MPIPSEAPVTYYKCIKTFCSLKNLFTFLFEIINYNYPCVFSISIL